MLLNKIRQFMYGRYGSDQLSFAIIILSVILSFINLFIGLIYLRLLSTILLAIAFFRVFSRNYYKRRKENQWFLNTISNIKIFFNFDREYKYYSCRNCKTKLRVPRGKGKLKITCPKCRNSFKGRS